MSSIVRAGLYIRTSREEENKVNRNSIQNQIEGLRQFCNNNNYMIVKIYVDENWTGSNFDRPKFNQMMEDAKAKIINTIIVKDLSRLGRNLYKMGDYLERIFPSMNIRFIAVSDDVDSNRVINDDVIYRNFFNDLYIKDIIKKLKYSLDNKAKTKPLTCRKGLCFGYESDIDGNWIIEEEEAHVVRRIFDDFLNNVSLYKIAKSLSSEKVMTSAYRKYFKYGDMNNIKHRGPKPNPDYYYKWDISTITYILKNRQYTGVVINKSSGKEYILENHHEPIISFDQFEIVQEKLKGNKSFSNQNNPLSSFVRCKCCDYAMVKTAYGIHKDVYQCMHCKMWIDNDVIDSMVKNEVTKRLNDVKPILTGNRLAKEKHRITSRINALENELTELILADAEDEIMIEYSAKIKALRDSLDDLSTNKQVLFDVNGNQLSKEQMQDFKLVAKILFKCAYFEKIGNEIRVEFIKR